MDPKIKFQQPKGTAGSVHPAIVMPVFRPIGGLRDTVQVCLALGLPVVVIQEGHHKDVSRILADMPVTRLELQEFQGRGNAVRAGQAALQRLGATHMIVVDPDRRYSSENITEVIKALEQRPDDLIITSPQGAWAYSSFMSRCKSAFANFWLRLQTGSRFGDAASPLRGYPLAVLTGLKLREKGMTFDAEVLVKSLWADVAVTEIPIEMERVCDRPPSYPARPIRDSLRLVLLNIHLAMRSITPIPHRKIDLDGKRTAKKVSILHPMTSLRRLLTENLSPGQLGLAVAMGIFLGTLPLIAFHSIAILFAANFFRLNKVAALSASQLCMPPIVPALCVEVGYFLRNGAFLTEISLETLGYQALDRILEWFIGAFFLAPLLALVLGGVTYLLALYILKTQLKDHGRLIGVENSSKEQQHSDQKRS